MNTIAIPAWGTNGLLPPFNIAQSVSRHRSPYRVSLLDLVMRLGATPARRQLLQGFLAFRTGLHRLGLCDGFQWLAGSFVENIELMERRAPADIDVTTFLHSPRGFQPDAEDLMFFDVDLARQKFSVDAYFVDFRLYQQADLVSESIYWYSVFSHRREQSWKGFIQVDLSPEEDAAALAWLHGAIRDGEST